MLCSTTSRVKAVAFIFWQVFWISLLSTWERQWSAGDCLADLTLKRSAVAPHRFIKFIIILVDIKGSLDISVFPHRQSELTSNWGNTEMKKSPNQNGRHHYFLNFFIFFYFLKVHCWRNLHRSEDRLVGKECLLLCSSRGSLYPYKNHTVIRLALFR